MDYGEWVLGAIGTYIGVRLTVGIAAAAQARARRLPRTGALELTHPPVFAWIGKLFMLDLPVIGGLYFAFHLARGGEAWTDVSALILLAVLACIAGTLRYMIVRERILLTDDGVAWHRAWRLPVRLRWDEIESLGYSSVRQRFLLTDQRGAAIKIGLNMVGIVDFCELVRERVPADRHHNAEAGFAEITRRQESAESRPTTS